jgi:hypothetical protein
MASYHIKVVGTILTEEMMREKSHELDQSYCNSSSSNWNGGSSLCGSL